MHDFRRLRVWQEAIELVVENYALTRRFPAEERFNLISQMNRACVSIASNIAEGAGRSSDGEFIQFLGYASGSCSELFTQMLIAQRLQYIAESDLTAFNSRLDSIHRMIATLIKNLKST